MLLPTKILVPIDGSENSKKALDFALDLSSKIGSALVLVHAIEVPISSYKYHRVADSLLTVLESSGRSLLKTFESRAASRGIRCEGVLVHGDPTTQILRVSNRKGCDCIIMGKRGLGRFERMLLGSVSDRIARLARVPVVIVK